MKVYTYFITGRQIGRTMLNQTTITNTVPSLFEIILTTESNFYHRNEKFERQLSCIWLVELNSRMWLAFSWKGLNFKSCPFDQESKRALNLVCFVSG